METLPDNNLRNNSESLHLTDKEIFTKIWTSPRMVFKYINDNWYEKYLYLLLVLSGISRGFDRASQKNMGDNMSLWGVIGVSILAGGLLGWITFYIYAALLSWTGKWLNGQSDSKSLLRVVCYGMIPSVAALVLLIPQIAIYGNEIFKTDGDIISADLGLNIIFYGTSLLEFILGIWTLVLCIIGISEVQQFSIGKSILNILLPVLVIFIPILLLVLLFNAF